MDGRDLFKEICKDYSSSKRISAIANEIPKFVVRKKNLLLEQSHNF